MPKRELIFNTRLMNAAGFLGFAPDAGGPIAAHDLGTFVTNPISLRPRQAAEDACAAEFPGGFLIHSGLPNPGFRAVLSKHSRGWAASEFPIIVHLMADRPAETQEMVGVLEAAENVMAVELGFAPLLADDIILLAIEMSRGELPLIACLPAEQIMRLGPQVLERGASAISVAAPRGTITHDGGTVSGRLYGPALFPQALHLVYAASRAGLPIIGAGGVISQVDADAMLAGGAMAVQLDSKLWVPKG